MHIIAGVDEAGRGALAGPVAAAAVVLDPSRIPDGITDSKVLTPASRAELEPPIIEQSVAWSVVLLDNDHIDRVNILQATYDAMHQAIDAVAAQLTKQGSTIDLLRIDGNRFRPHTIPHECLIKGDARDVTIGAASILAKTARDRWMIETAHERHPEYGFDRHKGYGTEAHRTAIREHGASPLHRKSFLSKILAPTLFDEL